MSPAPGDMPRDPDGERLMALARVPGWQAPAGTRLIDLAHSRADSGPVECRPGRSFVAEAIEELADVINYATWAARSGEVSEASASAACALATEAYVVLLVGAGGT